MMEVLVIQPRSGQWAMLTHRQWNATHSISASQRCRQVPRPRRRRHLHRSAHAALSSGYPSCWRVHGLDALGRSRGQSEKASPPRRVGRHATQDPACARLTVRWPTSALACTVRMVPKTQGPQCDCALMGLLAVVASASTSSSPGLGWKSLPRSARISQGVEIPAIAAARRGVC